MSTKFRCDCCDARVNERGTFVKAEAVHNGIALAVTIEVTKIDAAQAEICSNCLPQILIKTLATTHEKTTKD